MVPGIEPQSTQGMHVKSLAIPAILVVSVTYGSMFLLGSAPVPPQLAASPTAAVSSQTAALLAALGTGNIEAGPGLVTSGTAGDIVNWESAAGTSASFSLTVQNTGDATLQFTRNSTAVLMNIGPGGSETVLLSLSNGERLNWHITAGTTAGFVWALRRI